MAGAETESQEERTVKNISVQANGNKLTIEVDLTKALGPSSSGKTTLIASTEGNALVSGHPDMRFGLNVFKYPSNN